MTTQRILGTVKSYNEAKGWGFVEGPEVQRLYGKDIIFQRSEMRGADVTKGDRVTFDVTEGRNGPIAVNFEFPDTPESFTGTIKSFSPKNGWGFIECRATHERFGKDIILLKSELPPGFEGADGHPVRFSVRDGKKGPVASNVMFEGSSRQMTPRTMMSSHVIPVQTTGGRASPTDAAQASAFASGWPTVAASRLSGPAAAAQQMVVAAAAARGAYQGSNLWPITVVPVQGSAPAKGHGNDPICGLIKSFQEDKGYGFIHGDAIKSIYGKDVFVSKSSLNGQDVEPGDMVRFNVSMGQKGPMAQEVRLLPPGSFAADGSPGVVFAGKVKSFNADKGWGFVTSERTLELFGKDLFLHKRELPDPNQELPTSGDSVQFSVKLSQRGIPEATSLSYATADSYAPMRGRANGGGIARAAPF